MMDWAHAEDALARRLERDDLDDDGERLTDKDKTDNREQNLRVRQDADRRDSAAECQRARVAHEYLGWMRIEAQKGQAGHHHSHAEDGEVVVARHIADECIGTRSDGHRA